MKQKIKDILIEVSAWIISCAIFGFVLFFLFGCTKTEYITVEKVRTDTAFVMKWQRDSVWLHDSVYVTEKGEYIMKIRRLRGL